MSGRDDDGVEEAGEVQRRVVVVVRGGLVVPPAPRDGE
jgi:hypothetical protein